MSIDKRFAEFNNNINAVPPLNINCKSEFDNPSNSNKPRITFSMRILSAFLLVFETFSIHSGVNVSLLILTIKWQLIEFAAGILKLYLSNY